jgi:hypothetical protein
LGGRDFSVKGGGTVMPKLEYTPDEEISVHHESAIRQLARRFTSHEAGIPEWAKNAADAYVREGVARQDRIILLIFDDGGSGREASISTLDFVGLSSEDIETYFRRWADPDAARAGRGVSGVQGGHGHGGKSYMIQMFDQYAYIQTVKDGLGCKYGVPAGDVRFGYIPSRDDGRDFTVGDPRDELVGVLDDAKAQMPNLPNAIQGRSAECRGFTLVRGVGPKGYAHRIPVRQIVEKIVWDPQMVTTLQLCDVYVVVNGRSWNQGQPLALPRIEPIPGAEKARELAVPETLRDPDSREQVSTTGNGQYQSGKLVLHTSEKRMRSRPRLYRHHVRFIAASDFVGQIEMGELEVNSAYKDRMYGDCFLDSLQEYAQSDRRRLSESQLTRALTDWIQTQVAAYCQVFEARDKHIYDQQERDALSRMNSALDEWKNQFLDELMEGLWGEGEGTAPRNGERLPAGRPVRVLASASHGRAGLDVALRPTVKFFDNEGNRVRAVPHRWVSTDTNVAMVDEELLMIETFSFGTTEIYAETLDGKLRSNSIPLEVVHIHEIAIEPQQVEVVAGSRQRFEAVCTLSTGEQTRDVYLLWLVNNQTIAGVSSAGLVYAFEPGTTEVYAMDSHTTAAQPGKVTVLPAPLGGPGPRRGRAYPRVLISEIDRDPETDEPVSFTSDDPPVYQRVEDTDRNIWWINSASPLARLYLDTQKGYGYEGREWRIYHLERYIEILAKIRLSLEFLEAEEISYDMWLTRWDEIASQVQHGAATTLQQFIDTGTLPTS